MCLAKPELVKTDLPNSKETFSFIKLIYKKIQPDKLVKVTEKMQYLQISNFSYDFFHNFV